MMLILKKYLTGVGIIALAFSYNIGQANSATCFTPPTCDELGYTTDLASCNLAEYMTCPFDANKVYCPDCSNYPLKKLDIDTKMGATAECPYDSTSFKYISCAPGYTLQSGSCILADPCEGYDYTLPENCLMVSTCPQNSSRVKCMGCKTGYELDVDTHACISTFPYGFLAVEVTVNAGDSFGYRILGAFTIDWGDGTSESFNTGHLTVESMQVSELTEVMHQYTSAGTYTVIVGGTATSLRLQSLGNSKYNKLITKLVNLNLSTVQDYGNLFWYAINMVGNTNNIQLPSGLTNGSQMFAYCTGLTGSIPTLPSSLKDTPRMFENCSGLTGSIPTLPNSLEYASGMFDGCTGLTGTCPTKPNALSGLNCGYMFRGTLVTCTYCDDGI